MTLHVVVVDRKARVGSIAVVVDADGTIAASEMVTTDVVITGATKEPDLVDEERPRVAHAHVAVNKTV